MKFNKRFIITLVNENGTTKEISLYAKTKEAMENYLNKKYSN
jgi:hypothetical protein